jgi:hypothetical protein
MTMWKVVLQENHNVIEVYRSFIHRNYSLDHNWIMEDRVITGGGLLVVIFGQHTPTSTCVTFI